MDGRNIDRKESSRGRARSRARAAPVDSQLTTTSPTTPPPPALGEESATPQLSMYADMHLDGQRRSPNGSSNGESKNGNGSNGTGSNGNGNGSQSSGTPRGAGSPASDRGRGGTPRGASPLIAKGPMKGTKEVNVNDYLLTKPAGFVKTVPITDPSKAVKLITNYYPIETKDVRWSLYSIKIEPEVESDKLIRMIVSHHREQIGAYVRTGLQLYTVKPLDVGHSRYATTITSRSEEEVDITYQVTLDHVRDVGDEETVVIQFLNGTVRRMLCALEYKLMGRHYFDPQGKRPFQTWRLELWPGFQNSIRQQEHETLLNVESVWKVLQTDSVLHLITDTQRKFPNNPSLGKKAVEEALVGTMIVTPHNAKSYKISKVDWDQNPSSTFPTKDGAMITFSEYYQTKYGVTIRDKKQPLLIIDPTMRQLRQGFTQITLVPELCFPCGLTDKLRSNFRLMKDLAVCLHMVPTERVRTMQAFIDKAVKHPKVADILKGWGTIKEAPVNVKGRRLPNETIQLAGCTGAADDKADFTNALRGKPMLTTVELKKLAIVVSNHDKPGVDTLVKMMQKVANPMRFKIAYPIVVAVSNPAGYVNGVSDAYAKFNGDPDMIMVILANNNADNYAAVKKRCSVDYGVPSQCFLAKNIESKGLMSIATKLVIQMNAKLGGEPWGVSNPLAKFNLMVLGYDVHHAGPAGGKSIGAMTATMSTLGQYYSSVNQVQSGVEVESNVAVLFEKCVAAYKKRVGMLPGWIIMYRDGVGEGQLSDVYNLELAAFKTRIVKMYEGQPPPKLCFIVVNKRICTRFFLRLANDKYDNPLPGTVVDDVVTRPERYDFFLISQTARQGCVSPTYYNVLSDETGLGPEKIQKFTFKMCFMYFNWSGTVAVPAPCQNAHKLALQVGTALKRPARENLNHLLHFL